jgi:hydroxyacyl-ACP dehydratase HTD2-like protein with hotdog domain
MQKWMRLVMDQKPIRQSDRISASLSTALSFAIDDKPRLLKEGDGWPLGNHFMAFPSTCTEAELSSDGYTTEHAPPSPYNHRVWGGGSIEFKGPRLPIGSTIEQQTRVASVQLKGADEKAFVQLEKLVFKAGSNDWSIKELRNMVYKKEPPNPSIWDRPAMNSSRGAIINGRK